MSQEWERDRDGFGFSRAFVLDQEAPRLATLRVPGPLLFDGCASGTCGCVRNNRQPVAMPNRLSQEDIAKLLRLSPEDTSVAQAHTFTDVFIAGSGPIGCTYARRILESHPGAKVYMAEIGSQDHPIIGAHHKNSIKYQKDINSFVHVIKAALQPVSVPPQDTYLSTLGGAAWTPPTPGQQLTIQGYNPNQDPSKNLGASAITRTVGGMATHWTGCCPTPHEEERLNNPIDKDEFNKLLDEAKILLNVHSDQFDDSIRHTVVKASLGVLAEERGVQCLPLAVQRRADNPEYVTWTGADTILGSTASDPRFTLATEMRVTKLISHPDNPKQVIAAVLRRLNTDADELIIAKAFIVACGAICTPQILWNSGIRPHALGRYLSEQSLAFCQIVLKREIVDSIPKDPRWAHRIAEHKKQHPTDPVPIPWNDPEPQVMIPYSPNYPWYIQIHRDAFQYGDIGPKADPRVVVDLRFFGKSDICEENRVTFGQAGITDLYGMPQPTFEVVRTQADGERDQRMMNDMTRIANILGAYLPGSYPQFMEPGLPQHITGTTRIGTNSRDSVVDPTSKVHNFDNLWVGGNGVIPDSTTCNPTRTSMAYALKGAQAVVEYLQ